MPAGLEDALHLGDGRQGILQVHEHEPRSHEIETIRFQSERIRAVGHEARILNPLLLEHFERACSTCCGATSTPVTDSRRADQLADYERKTSHAATDIRHAHSGTNSGEMHEFFGIPAVNALNDLQSKIGVSSLGENVFFRLLQGLCHSFSTS